MTDQNQESQTLGSRNSLWFADDKTVEFKPWTGREELALSKFLHKNRSKLEGGKIGRHISLKLSFMCTRIAGKEFWREDDQGNWVEVTKQVDRESHIRGMWEADVIVAYLLLRNDALEDSMSPTLPILSPHDIDRKRECDWVGDLDTIPFCGTDSIEDHSWTYKLRRPLKIRGKEYSELPMQPLKWATAESVRLETAPYEVGMRAIAGSVQISPMLRMDELNRMRKPDIECLAQGIDDHPSGLNLEIEVYDPIAEKTFESSLPWLSPGFFSVSSQSAK